MLFIIALAILAQPPPPMPLISRSVPAWASSCLAGICNACDGGPDCAHDADPLTAWVNDVAPSWLAYDLSSVPPAQRQAIAVVQHYKNVPGYDVPPADQQPYMCMPLDYTVEKNTAPGGGPPPTIGWTTAVALTGNWHNGTTHLLANFSANWLRVRYTRSTDSVNVCIDMDVYSAPNGISDAWLMVGDSITGGGFGYTDNDAPARVAAADSTRWPAMICAAVGGAGADYFVPVIDSYLADYLGKYVVLALGTNSPTGADIETLVQHVIAAGRTPVIPKAPWCGNCSQAQLDAIRNYNETVIDGPTGLYARYPAIRRGPDLWAVFYNRPDLMPDIHPSPAGYIALRQAWADAMR